MKEGTFVDVETHQRIEAVVAAFAKGEVVVVADDDDRENEGDLFVAASLCTPEKMAFIIRNTSGIVCAPLDSRWPSGSVCPHGGGQRRAARYRLHGVGRRSHGLTTGISAEERNNTVRALANGNSGATDFVRPGHVFPLVARTAACSCAPVTLKPASISAGLPTCRQSASSPS